MTKRLLCFAALLLAVVTTAMAQRTMDKLDRGLIAIKTTNGVYCSWRIFGEEYYDVKYNLYRDGAKVASNLNVSNYTDATGTTSNTYTVKAVVRGVEETTGSKEATVWAQNYLEITPTHENLKSVYVPNDACCADVDGDGVVEILMKFDNQSEIDQSYPKNGPKINGVDTKEYSLFECLKLDGTRLWYVNCGPNMGDFQNNEQNIAAYDWDGDGKAEAIMRAADGTTIVDKFGQTHVIGDASKNYRAATGGGSNWFMHDGAEYLVYINGETGVPYQIMEYPLKRLESGETNLEAAWGDGYGHRSTKHFFGAPYLDGRKPSIFLARGIYTRHKMIALDVNPDTHELTVRWRWSCNDASSPWYGNGYHNYGIADVDWDGRDEICFGSMVIDDNGHGLSTTGYGHGDAQHHGDFNPYWHGQEFFGCLEDAPHWGNDYRDATTGKVYYKHNSGRDDGRSMAGNFTNDYPGAMAFSGYDEPISCVTADHIDGMGKGGIPDNFRIYWDGDLCEEGFNGTGSVSGGTYYPAAGAIFKYNQGKIQTLEGSLTNNYTKATPCYQGDLFGDWREEVMMRTADNKVRIYSTTIPTEWRNYTLWHDIQYRNAMVWQMNGYNQPPHVSYFLGELEDITMAPPALTMAGRTEVKNNGTIGSKHNDQQVLLAETGDMTVNVSDGTQPYIFFDNAPSWVQGTDENGTSGFNAPINYQYYTHTLTGGAFTGNMRLVKQGDGTLVLPNVTETYTGNTDVWAGTLKFDGTMQKSPVWLNRHTSLESAGTFNAGIKADYNATIYPGGKTTTGSLTTTTLALGFGSRVVFDLNNDQTADQLNATTLTIEKKDWQYGPEYNAPVFQIVPHFATGLKDLPAGKYLIATIGNVVGKLSDIKVEGLDRQKAQLVQENDKLYIEIVALRPANEVVWSGNMDTIWDLGTTKNFKLDGTEDVFVSDDAVTFNDAATRTTIQVDNNVSPSSIVFANSTKDYTLQGEGSIIGNATMTMQGSGNVTINMTNKTTGGVTLKSGKVTPATLANAEGTEYGALGSLDNDIYMDGGTLGISSALTSSQPITLMNGGGTIDIDQSASLTQSGAINRQLSNSKGALHKTGNGTLNLGTTVNIPALYVDKGTVNLSESNNIMSTPDTIVFNGTNVKVYDADNSYSYSTNNAHFKVTEGSTGYLYLDGRCNYYGKLYGSGTLNVVARYVRGDLRGNWSEFEGTVVCNQNGQEFRWFNTNGLPKGTMNIPAGSTVNCESRSFTLGNLTGSGTLSTTGTVTIGTRNEPMQFSGTFSGAKIIKTGTGSWTFKSPINGTIASLTFNGGDVILNNTSTSTLLLGNNLATIEGEATVKGVGTLAALTVQNGGAVMPGSTTSSRRYGAITSTGSLNMYAGSTLTLIIYNNQNKNTSRSYLTVGGDLKLMGDLTIEAAEGIYTPAVGDEITLWTCKQFVGTPTQINLPALPDGMAWDTTDLLSTTGILRVVAATGIQNVKAANRNDGRYYTLDGRPVEQPTQKGLYIRNGKKVVIK